jgi:ribonuclease BN (tRNA processing enzyme)
MLQNSVSVQAAILASLLLGACSGTTQEAVQNGPAASSGTHTCSKAEVAVQVLGSGGPIAEGSRAGTSYAVWLDGKPKLMIDAGPGSFIRFGEAGMRLNDFEAIALSHLHADHTAGLAGILNSGSFEASSDPLTVIGPAAGSVFPGTSDFLTSLFGRDGGAWAYLGGYLDGGDARRPITVVEVSAKDPDLAPTKRIEITSDLFLTAIPVRHGEVPSLAFLIEAKAKDIVFAGDQNAFSTSFDRLLRDKRPDLLIAHHVIPEGEGQPIGLHRPPSGIGEMAKGMAARQLLLSHHMNRSYLRLTEGQKAIAAHYRGPVLVAFDGMCVPL